MAETINWQSRSRRPDPADLWRGWYLKKSQPEPESGRELYQDEGMSSSSSKPGHENPVPIGDGDRSSQPCFNYIGSPAVVTAWTRETSEHIAKNPLFCPFSNRILEDKIQREYWVWSGSLAQKTIIYKDKIGRDRRDRRKRLVDPRKGSMQKPRWRNWKNRAKQPGQMPAQNGRTHQIRISSLPIMGAVSGTSLTPARGTTHAPCCMTFTNPLTHMKPFKWGPASRVSKGWKTEKKNQKRA